MVNELNMNCGTAGMVCSCNSSRYKYESCGHVVTGDLSIIKDVKLRNLIDVYLETGRKRCINLLMRRLEA